MRWLITGVSTGIGAALARAALERGDSVAGTTRSGGSAERFTAMAAGQSHGIHADVADSGAAPAIVARAITAMGGIDVLVNNAGYALAGAVESVDDQAALDQFNANFFGPLALIRAALPALRDSGRGRILNISSNAAIESYAGLGLYCASKAAMSAMSDTLDQEVAKFGVRAIAVEPTGFRTSFGGTSLQRARGEHYSELDQAQDAGFARSNGRQAGDPDRAAAALIAVATMDDPPRRIPLGSNALGRAKDVLTARIASYEEHAALTRHTDFSA